MYSAHGTYYTEEHSVSFGEIVTVLTDGTPHLAFETIANTWTDWHLIPSSRPSIEHPNVVTKFIEIPGADGMLDLTTFLSGKANYGQRNGSLSFYVDNDHENWETIRRNIVTTLHGKRMKMRLMDDPDYYYDGRFSVGAWESGADHSGISISYQLEPYKLRISTEGTEPTLWDPFNFETDYDYYTLMGSAITVTGSTKTYNIYAQDYPFMMNAEWISGRVSVSFGGVTKVLRESGSAVLGQAQNGNNILSVSGSGSIRVSWRGGSL